MKPRVRSMIETYPEADRYWVCTGSEAHIAADDPRTQTLIRDYADLRDLLPQKPPAAMDTDLADVAVAAQLMSRIKARYPAARLGAELIFRGGQLRALDAALPKDVWLMNMVNWDGETAMSDFDGIQGRELVVWPQDHRRRRRAEHPAQRHDVRPRRDDFRHRATRRDGCPRPTEQGARRGTERAVHRRRRLEPADPAASRSTTTTFAVCSARHALDALLKAYMLLEENEKTLGWHGQARTVRHLPSR